MSQYLGYESLKDVVIAIINDHRDFIDKLQAENEALKSEKEELIGIIESFELEMIKLGKKDNGLEESASLKHDGRLKRNRRVKTTCALEASSRQSSSTTSSTKPSKHQRRSNNGKNSLECPIMSCSYVTHSDYELDRHLEYIHEREDDVMTPENSIEDLEVSPDIISYNSIHGSESLDVPEDFEAIESLKQGASRGHNNRENDFEVSLKRMVKAEPQEWDTNDDESQSLQLNQEDEMEESDELEVLQPIEIDENYLGMEYDNQDTSLEPLNLDIYMDKPMSGSNNDNHNHSSTTPSEPASSMLSYCTEKSDHVICNVCSKKYSYMHQFRRHFSDKHVYLLSSSLKCNQCDFACTSFYYLDQHMRKHSGQKPFACPFNGCPFRSHSEAKVIIHFKKHHIEGAEKTLLQPKTDKKSSKRASLVTFIDKKRKKNRSLTFISWKTHFTLLSSGFYACKHCDKQIKIFAGLEQHYNRIHNRSALPYQCKSPSCDYGTLDYADLARHETVCEQILKERGFEETDGNEKNDYEDYEDQDNNTHALSQDVSNLSFSSNYKDLSFLLHFTLSEDNSLICNLCNEKFNSIPLFKRHYWRKHNRSGLPCKCDWNGCSYATGTPARLEDHKRSKHLKVKPFKCPIYGCCYSSSSKESLHNHIKSKKHKKKSRSAPNAQTR